MLPTIWDLGSLLAITSIILLSSSLLLTRKRKSMINKRHLELVGNIAGMTFLVVAFYLIWRSLV